MHCAACHAPLRCTPAARVRLATSARTTAGARALLLLLCRTTAGSSPDTRGRHSRTLRSPVRVRAPRCAPSALRRGCLAPQARLAARRAAAMGGCVSVEEKPCPPGTFTSSALLELNLLRAAAMGDVPAAKAALAAGATTAAKTAVRAAARARAARARGLRRVAARRPERGDRIDCAAPHATHPCSARRRRCCALAARAATAATDQSAAGLKWPHPPPAHAQCARLPERFAAPRAGEPQRFDHGGPERAA